MWENITIKKYRQIEDILKGREINLETCISLLAVIEGNSEEYYYDIPYKDLHSRIMSIGTLNNVPESKVYKSYTIQGRKYRLIDNISSMKTGQFIDYCNTLKSSPEDYALLISFVLIPEGKKYGEYDAFETGRMIDEGMNIVDAIAITRFFFVLLESLQKAILQYSNRMLKRMLLKQKVTRKMNKWKFIKALKASGAG